MAEKKKGVKPAPRKSTGPTSRAKAEDKPRKRIRNATGDALKALYPDGVRTGPGRPKDTPDVWTPEHVNEVAEAMWDYVQKTDCPSLAEMCFKLHLRVQRISEFPALGEMREALNAKRLAYLERAGMTLNKDHGQRGAFLLKMACNVGPFSFTEKQELEHSGSVAVQIVDDIQ